MGGRGVGGRKFTSGRWGGGGGSIGGDGGHRSSVTVSANCTAPPFKTRASPHTSAPLTHTHTHTSHALSRPEGEATAEAATTVTRAPVPPRLLLEFSSAGIFRVRPAAAVANSCVPGRTEATEAVTARRVYGWSACSGPRRPVERSS